MGVEHDPALNITGDITISAWIYLTRGGLYQAIVTKCVGSGGRNNPFDFRTETNPEPRLAFVRADASGHERVYSNVNMPLSQWHHVLVRVENNVPDFYVNGVITGKYADTIFTRTPTGNTNPLLIGARDDGLEFHGRIDEVMIFDRALSSEEIQQLYQNSRSSFGDYHLLPDSPCIDAGVDAGIYTDIEGSVRPFDYPGVDNNGELPDFDMGAYEHQGPRIVYVDDDATGANDGSSWDNAFNDLQDALADAIWGDRIHVAQGTYTPAAADGDPESTFQLANGIMIKGGFAGAGAYEPDSRDPQVYPTILSGDLARNDSVISDPADLPDDSSRDENASHVVTGSGTNHTAVLDGFTITGGATKKVYGSNDERAGGGIVNIQGSPTLINCTITYNYANYGGGMFNLNSNPAVSNCVFRQNCAIVGAGVYNEECNGMFADCIFEKNDSFNDDASGSGMYNWNSDIEIARCVFKSNKANDDSFGCAIYNRQSTLDITDCTFSDNSTWGGGAVFADRCSVRISNCDFTANSAVSSGAAIYAATCDSVIIDTCSFVENFTTADNSKGAAVCTYNCSVTLESCMFKDNQSGHDAVVTNEYSDVEILKCVFEGNSAVFSGAAVYNKTCRTAAIDECIFTENFTTDPYGRGAGVYNSSTPMRVDRCLFSNNQSGLGAAVANDESNTEILNCIFTDNKAGETGSAICNFMNESLIANCTFSRNLSERADAATIYSGIESETTLVNCILWGNSTPAGWEIYLSDDHGSSIASISHCDISGGRDAVYVRGVTEFDWGPGNIDYDPLFADARNGDYHLMPLSPCIDTGDNEFVEPGTLDFDGNQRIINNTVDMGALEAPITIVIQADLDIMPRVINRNNRRARVLARVRLPENVTIDQIDRKQALVLLPGEIEAERQHVFSVGRTGRKVVYVFAFFDKDRLMQAVPDNGNVELTVTGRLNDGQVYSGRDTVTIVGRTRPPRGRPERPPRRKKNTDNVRPKSKKRG